MGHLGVAVVEEGLLGGFGELELGEFLVGKVPGWLVVAGLFGLILLV